MSNTAYIAIMVALVAMSAYFSATETAFSSLNKTRLKAMVEKGNKRAEHTLRLSEQYDKLISTILIGNNVVNISVASIGTVFFVKLYGDIGATVSTVAITLAVLIFGEISPKSIAKDCPEKFAMFSTPLIQVLIWVLTPINFIFSLWKKLLSKVLRIEESAKISDEELIMMVEEVQQEGSLDNDEGELIKNAIEFKELEAEDILTHRVDLEAVPITADKKEVAALFAKTQFSRFLVYEDNIDNIVGIVHLKDFFNENGITERDLTAVMTNPVFIQKSEKINDLLKILQKSKSHIAVVIDEYGGTLGIVTMEDIIEELVGEIWDEHDEVVEEIVELEENKYKILCTAPIDKVLDIFDINDESEEASVGGWVMSELDKIPEEGDSFSYKNVDVIVTKTDDRRVLEIEATVNPVEDEDEKDSRDRKAEKEAKSEQAEETDQETEEKISEE